VAQTLREFARQIGEDGHHDVGMRGGKLLQLLDGKAVTDHPLVGDHIGRAGAAVEQCHFAEGNHPRRPRAASFLPSASEP
jgi:hypothetical protein